MQLRKSINASSRLHSFNGELQSLCASGALDRAISLIETSPRSLESSSYLCLLRACAKRKALSIAKRLQRHLERCTVDLSFALGEHLVVTLARCGAAEDAFSILHRLPYRTVFTWTAIISSLVDTARPGDALILYERMLEDGVDPDPYTFVSLFRACGCLPDLEHGKLLHFQARSHGFSADLFVCSALVCMYGKCGDIENACAAFGDVSEHNTVSWTAMASAFVDEGLGVQALLTFRQMVAEGLNPNQGCFVIAIQACGLLSSSEQLRGAVLEIVSALHANARIQGLASDAFIATTLVSVYGKCGALASAWHTFLNLSRPTAPSWNALISAHIENGFSEEALKLYVRMVDLGVHPDNQTYVFTLQACKVLAERNDGETTTCGNHMLAQNIVRALHAVAQLSGFISDVFVGTTLLSAYGKCGLISDAESFLATSPNCNLTTWNALLSAYMDQGEAGKTLVLYGQMLEHHIGMDDATCVSVLQACGDVGCIDICTQVHFYILCIGLDDNMHLICSVLDAYGSCQSRMDFGNIFDVLSLLDVAILNAYAAGYAREGNFEATDWAFHEWKLAGFEPDGITFIALLSSCSHAGLVDLGAQYFGDIGASYHFAAESTHYVCMVDLLGRAGALSKVENILRRINILHISAVWWSLMCSFDNHGSDELMSFCASHVHLGDSAADVLLPGTNFVPACHEETALGSFRGIEQQVSMDTINGRHSGLRNILLTPDLVS